MAEARFKYPECDAARTQREEGVVERHVIGRGGDRELPPSPPARAAALDVFLTAVGALREQAQAFV